MNPSHFWLALRFVLGRDGRGRLLTMTAALGIGAGVAVLVAGLALPRAFQAREDRNARLAYGETTWAPGTGPDDVLLLFERSSTFDDSPLDIRLVAAVGDAPLPPGTEGIPAPGEVWASPALAELLRGPERELLVQRVPGRLVGTISTEGLVRPDQLLAYVGEDLAALERLGATPVARFGHHAPRFPLPQGAVLAITLATAGVLLQVMLFIWTATRLSAEVREMRLASLRLLGATPSSIRFLTAVEVGMVALIGSLLGLAMFFAGRQVLPWTVIFPDRFTFFRSDLVPPPGQAAILILAVPLLSVLVAWASMRRVVKNPMETRRRARLRSRAAIPGAIALAAGVALWTWIWLDPGISDDDQAFAVILRVGAWVLTAIGVAGVSAWVGTKGAALAVRRGGVAAYLGARRLAFDRRGAGRLSAGVVVVTFAATVSLGMVWIFEQYQELAISTAGLRETTLLAYPGDWNATAEERLRAVPGVTEAVPFMTLSARSPDNFFDAVAVDCSRLGTVMEDPVRCEPGDVLRTDAAAGWGVRPGADVRVGIPGRPRLHVRVNEDGRVADLSFFQWGAPVMLDVTALPPRMIERLAAREILIATDGDPVVAERIREAFFEDEFGFIVTTAEGADDAAWTQESGIAGGIEIAAVLAMIVATASLLVSLVGTVHDRRRPLATLAAAGVAPGLLRRSFVVQAMAPLVAGLALSLGCGALVLAAHVHALELPLLPALAPGVRVAGLTLLGGMTAVLLTIPAIGRSVTPSALHAE